MENNHVDSIFNEITKRFDVAKSDLLTYYDNNPQLFEFHARDGMLAKNSLHYFLTGFEAAYKCYKTAKVQGLNSKNNLKILDLPCGFGRVTRWLRFFFKNPILYVSDIMPAAQLFCSTTFFANSIDCSKEISDISLPSEIDLVFIGSLFTHLPEPEIKQYLTLFRNNMSKQGLCIFTTHGTFVEERLFKREKIYGLDENGCNKILSELHFSGFGFAPYPKSIGYGISVFRELHLSFVIGMLDMKILSFERQGWDNHQDFISVVKDREIIIPETKFCPCCRKPILAFISYNDRKKAKCPNCSSLERHRYLAYLFNSYILKSYSLNILICSKTSEELANKIELSKDKHSIETINHHDNIDLYYQDDMLKVKENHYDIILIFHFLESAANIERELRTLYKSISDGGLLIVKEVTHSASHTQRRGNFSSDSKVEKMKVNTILGSEDFILYLSRAGFRVHAFNVSDLAPNVIAYYGFHTREVIYFCYR